MHLNTVFAGLLGLASVASATEISFIKESSSEGSLPPIEIKGNAFFNSKTGERFYIRGVDYQPGGSSDLVDALADKKICGRDIPYFKELGINTIRVYTVDNTLDHDECMAMLDEAGIYLILDINTPTTSISRIDPICSYNSAYLQNIFATVDVFAKYNNVLGLFAGNEVINDKATTNTATQVKAVVRDLKKYIKSRNYRKIPVGYSAADVADNVVISAQYFNCGDDEDSRVDMFGVNDYSWCGSSSFKVSGYAEKVSVYGNFSVPLFLSEFGCNAVPGPRPFNEIEAIYSDKMTSVFSGGLVYEYSQEASNYGLVKIEGDKVTKLKDFDNLKDQYKKVKNPSGDGGYTKSNKHAQCPAYQQGVWEANVTLPEMPSAASAFFKDGAGAPQGTTFSSQNLCGSGAEQNSNYKSNEKASSSVSSSVAESTTSSAETSSASASSRTKNFAAAGPQVPTVFSILLHGMQSLLL